MEVFKNIKLDKKSSQHLYIQLYIQLKELIRKNKIPNETKLPAIRKLATILNVNNITIVNAYRLLEQEGYVYKKIGSGTFVNHGAVDSDNDILLDEETINLYHDDNRYDEESETLEKRMINFANTAPTPDLFPVKDFKKVLNTILDRDKGKAFIYQESQGYFPLRKTISNYLKDYNIYSSYNNIQIVSGAQQGIDILSKSLVDYGDIVFTESPTYSGAIAAFKSRSARIIEIPIKPDGMDILALENKLLNFRPKFIYLMPNFQNPTGYSYSNDKKKKILYLANKYDAFIIEDDYLSDLAFNNKKNYTLKSMDKDDRVIYIKSFSKIFMPGLRLAFMIIPNTIYNDVLSAKHISDISTSGLIQRAIDLYLNTNQWQEHIRYMEDIYRERFNTLIESVVKYMPKEITFTLPKGGLNLWLSLPHGLSSNELYKLCLENEILIVPGKIFYKEQKDNENFRISISSLYKEEIPNAIKKLSRVILKFLDQKNNKRQDIDVYTPFL